MKITFVAVSPASKPSPVIFKTCFSLTQLCRLRWTIQDCAIFVSFFYSHGVWQRTHERRYDSRPRTHYDLCSRSWIVSCRIKSIKNATMRMAKKEYLNVKNKMKTLKQILRSRRKRRSGFFFFFIFSLSPVPPFVTSPFTCSFQSSFCWAITWATYQFRLCVRIARAFRCRYCTKILRFLFCCWRLDCVFPKSAPVPGGRAGPVAEFLIRNRSLPCPKLTCHRSRTAFSFSDSLRLSCILDLSIYSILISFLSLSLLFVLIITWSVSCVTRRRPFTCNSSFS